MWWVLSVLLVTFLVYIYYIQFYKIACPQIFNDDLVQSGKLKTGDIILFKAYNNFNSIFIGSYFGHIGIVFIDPSDPTQTPLLFEANGVEHAPLKDHHSRDGIYLTPLEDRIKKYKGRCFLKPLNDDISLSTIIEFKQFIEYALDNMYYHYSVVSDGIKKGLAIERCTNGTNCGQLVFLSLIKLGILDIDYYDKPITIHLKWVANLGAPYGDIIEIIDHPFAY